jgi:transposase
LLSVVGIGGVLAKEIFQGTTNQIRVASFFYTYVYPNIPPNSAIIMDNARHHRGWVQHFLEALFATKNVEIIYFPSYSPDLSPVENFFGMVKFFLKDDRVAYQNNRIQAILNAISKVQSYHFKSFFELCGYL